MCSLVLTAHPVLFQSAFMSPRTLYHVLILSVIWSKHRHGRLFHHLSHCLDHTTKRFYFLRNLRSMACMMFKCVRRENKSSWQHSQLWAAKKTSWLWCMNASGLWVCGRAPLSFGCIPWYCLKNSRAELKAAHVKACSDGLVGSLTSVKEG